MHVNDLTGYVHLVSDRIDVARSGQVHQHDACERCSHHPFSFHPSFNEYEKYEPQLSPGGPNARWSGSQSQPPRPSSQPGNKVSAAWYGASGLLDRLFHPPSSHSRTCVHRRRRALAQSRELAVTELSMRRRYLAARHRIVAARVAWVRLRAPSRLDGPAIESEPGALPICCLIGAKDAGATRCRRERSSDDVQARGRRGTTGRADGVRARLKVPANTHAAV